MGARGTQHQFVEWWMPASSTYCGVGSGLGGERPCGWLCWWSNELGMVVVVVVVRVVAGFGPVAPKLKTGQLEHASVGGGDGCMICRAREWDYPDPGHMATAQRH